MRYISERDRENERGVGVAVVGFGNGEFGFENADAGEGRSMGKSEREIQETQSPELGEHTEEGVRVKTPGQGPLGCRR